MKENVSRDGGVKQAAARDARLRRGDRRSDDARLRRGDRRTDLDVRVTKISKIGKFSILHLFCKFCKFLAGSFSAVSKRNFARKYAFDSIFQDLQDFHTSAPLQSQKFRKNSV